MRRTKEQAAETGRQILHAAESLFLEKGYDEVTLEEIATQAGVTRGAVHWHFKNKYGLLLVLRDTAQEPFLKLADELSAGDGRTSLEKLGDVVSDLFEGLENDPRQQGLIRVMMRLDITLSETEDAGNSTFHERMHAISVRIFQAVERDLGLRAPWTPEKAASMLNAMISGLVMEWAMKRSAFRLFPDGSLFVRTLLAGLIK